MQELIPLEDNSGELKLTVAYYYLPSGRLVHKKKNATDWGVEPQIVVPMNEDQEKFVLQEHYEQELFHRPLTKSITRPSTSPTTEPLVAASSTRPTDPQLEAAISTMIGHIILGREGHSENLPVATPVAPPATQPTSGPS